MSRRATQSGAGNSGFGQRLAASRSQRGFSQSAIAARAGLAPSYLSRIETGKIQPTVPTAQKIAKAMRIPLAELLGPTPAQQKGEGCPISASGTCLMDLIDPKWDLHPGEPGEHYSPRQVRLLRRFTALVREGSPDLLKGLELVVVNLLDQSQREPKRRKRARAKSRD
ncbi:MAG: helix-turn-helix domain-containing protein [Myxococcales bacterium]|nr:helix-turn-helix domain-containing protein [Myxococcales bacterium]